MAEESPERTPGLRMLARIAKLRCPRCGRGRLFDSFFVRAERCESCKWRYEREAGFWVGGSEVHMFASYGISVVIFMPLLILLGPTPMVQAGAIIGHVGCSLMLFRFSRSFFIGMDYWFDPEPPRSDDDDGGEGVPVEPRPRDPSRGATLPRTSPRRTHVAGGRAARANRSRLRG